VTFCSNFVCTCFTGLLVSKIKEWQSWVGFSRNCNWNFTMFTAVTFQNASSGNSSIKGLSFK
jgi:hypothetical protein